MEIRQILVPTDFSSHADKALDAAMGLARQFNAKLHLFHAYHLPVTVATPEHVVIPRDFWTSVREAASKKLAGLVEKVQREGLEAEAHLTEMAAAPAITEIAETLGVDLIVMGTRGNTGIKHVLLGSVAERTLRTAPCPVLTLKDGSK
jgi:nucleotide-binding universal stress UspA family protein